MCKFHCLAYKGLVLNQITLDMEIIVTLEILGLQILGNEVQSGTQIYCKGAFGVASAHEHHRTAA